ncbi:DUF6701 domain-containing protein [Gilvimarinus algae]|uniref:PA14 domain-containing protein n=1 Tax=Gilvimarinus algae TaxID=3058037 RepID=A0ABT8TK44_9GAMM|nr:DUF6701 domain-containing protein [Gilvimarinus sp. SDUM040014]MDO3383006.1 PA14 domain-containing protein [Gilvimarinus sp. SDUM040014]
MPDSSAKRLSAWLLLSLMLLCSAQAGAVACQAIFTNGWQTHTPGGQVNAGYQAVVSGGGQSIDTANLATQAPPGQPSCGGGTCVASGSPAAASTPAFVTGSGSGGAINLGYQGSASRPAGDYATVSLDNEAVLTFTTANGTYLTRGINANFRSQLRFASGTYWINGSLQLANDVILRRNSGSGPVRLFVNGNVSIGFGAQFQNFAPGELLIYSTGNVNILTRNNVPAFVYAQGTVQTDFRAVITGGLSGSQLSIGQETLVNYQGGVLPSVDFSPFCGGGPPPAVLVGYWRMDEAQWTGAAAEVLDSSGNNLHGTASGSLTEDDAPALTGNPGTCGYGVFDGATGYVTVGHNALLNGQNGLSYSAWVKADSWSGIRQVMGKSVHGGGSGRAQMGIFSEGGSLKARVETAAGRYEVSATLPATGSWVHVAAVFEGNRLVLYINGGVAASASFGATQLVQTADPLVIGKRVGTSEYFFAGDIDEVRVHQGSLTQTQVSSLASERHECLRPLCGGEQETTVGGLLGDYYNSTNFTGGIVGTRLDGPVDFNWASANPGVTGVNDNQFSVEWNGFIRATETGSYRFQTASDDGVRLYVDNQLVIQRWNDHGVTTDTSAAINLTAGQVYPVRLQFYENGGLAEIRLRWQTPGSGSFVPIPRGTTPTLGQGLYYCQSEAVAYYTIEHGGTGVTCEAEPVRITAYDSSDTPIAPPAGTTLDLATAPASGVWVDGSPYEYSGAESQIVLYLQQTTPATLNINVFDGTASEAAWADPDLTFNDSGIRFYANRATTEGIPNQVAGQEDGNPVLRVVERDTDTGACVAQVRNRNLPVDIAYECRNPGACVAGQILTLNTSAAAPNNAGSAIVYNSAGLSFDNDGYAAIPLEYSDVGRVRLHASMTVPASGNNPSVTASGTSTEFVVKPYTLVAARIERPNGSANPATTSSGAGFVAAGEPFTVVVEARNARGNPTPNFGNESPTRESPTLVLNSLVYPVGGDAGALTNGAAFSFLGGNSGRFENTGLTWNQVGSMTLLPQLASANYLGAGDIVSETPSADIGRFYPHHFRVTSSSATNSCGAYTYLQEPAIGLDFTLEAHAFGGGVVSNYDNGLGYSQTASVSYTAENNDDGTDLSARVSAELEPAQAQWGSGVMNASLDDALFARDTVIEAPLTALQLGLRMNDPLDGRALADDQLNTHPGASGDCLAAGNCSAAALGNTLTLRYGRLNLASAYGPESLDLPVSFTTEYYNGVRWQTNGQDNCSEIALADIGYPAGSIDVDANRNVTVGGGVSRGEYPGAIGTDTINFSAGVAAHYFSAPGNGNTGPFTVTVDLTDYPWLQFNWDTGPDTEITGQYEFGSYRGHDRIIYWREVLQ